MTMFKKIAITSVLLIGSNFVNADVIKDLGLTGYEIKPTPIANIDVIIADQGIFYISKDRKYFLNGEIFKIEDKQKKITSLNEDFLKIKDEKFKAKIPMLKQKLDNLKTSMIVFPADNEKYVVSVFFDYTCHYCHELFSHIKEYNDLGITLQFLAFPRGGLQSEVAQYMETIYTSTDPMFALKEAEQNRLPTSKKTPDLIKKHYELGLEYGIAGTPAIVMPNGNVIPGYLEPAQLLEELKK